MKPRYQSPPMNRQRSEELARAELLLLGGTFSSGQSEAQVRALVSADIARRLYSDGDLPDIGGDFREFWRKKLEGAIG
jgi:hypothetical protein